MILEMSATRTRRYAPSATESRRIIGSGEMAERVRSYDWGATPLGPIDSWSRELTTMVNLTLCSPLPARTMWGRELILIYNDAYRPIPGRRHPEALGRPAKEVYREAWHVVGPLLEAALTTGETCYYEKLVVPLATDDGTQDFYLNYSFNPIFEEGRIAGLFGSLQDVTGEVIATRRLRESEARASRILQSIGDAVIVTDQDICVTAMNPVAELLTGWRIGDALGKPLTEVFSIVNERTRKPIESPASKVKATASVVAWANHTVLVGRDGKETPIDDSGAPILDEEGKLTGIVLVFRDVAQRRQAERQKEKVTEQEKALLDQLSQKREEAERQRSEIESVYQTAPIGLALFDVKDFRYLRVNKRQADFFALTPEELVGRTVMEMAPIDGLRELLEQVLDGRPVVNFPLEGELVTGPGERRSWLVSYFPVFAPDGTVQAITAATLDVTQQRKAEHALIESEKLAVVGRLASSIAHEINNPLESVTNLLYLAGITENLAEVRERLDTAQRELRRVSAITNQTLRFHKQATKPLDVTSEELMKSVVLMYQGRIVNARVRIEERYRAHQSVRCFEGEIRQVLSNLINNAIDAIDPGGGRLLLRSRTGRDWASGRHGLVLTIADTGSGMSQPVLRRIFEPFYTTKGAVGTGLGLWVSLEIINRHHGALHFRSSQKPGHSGTVFTVFLPFDGATR